LFHDVKFFGDTANIQFWLLHRGFHRCYLNETLAVIFSKNVFNFDRKCQNNSVFKLQMAEKNKIHNFKT